VLAYVKNLLIYNGFRPNMALKKYWARQIKLYAIQDGLPYDVLVVKSGPGQIAIQRSGYHGYGVFVNRFNLSFDA
jgi:hypothetical protein